MVNSKYMVLFMIGIFFALGLGIIIGITLENQNIIENQQTHLIHEIEEHFVSMRAETEQMKTVLGNLEDQKTQLQELSSLLLNELVQGKLTGINAGLITFSNLTPMTELLEFLKLAGVSIQSSVTLINNSSNIFNDETAVNAVQRPDEFITTIVQELVYSMQYGNVTPLTQEAMDLMMISHSGHFNSPVDYIILITQGSSTLDYDNILIQNAVDAEIPIIVVDTEEFDKNTISKYRSLEISTINQINSIYGKLALACILSGYNGNFGPSDNGVDLLPSPLFYQKFNSEVDYSNMIFEGEGQ